jgi:hypothetical protein
MDPARVSLGLLRAGFAGRFAVRGAYALGWAYAPRTAWSWGESNPHTLADAYLWPGAAFSVRVASVEEGGTDREEGECVATEEHPILERGQGSGD